MSIELTSLLHQLKIASLAELCAYKADFIAESFGEEQLNRLNSTLRDYLWQAAILPAGMKYLTECELPLKVLGLAPHIHVDLVNDGVQTVTELIQRDTTDHLTTQWPIRDRLAVRARIFCLLTLPTEQLNWLKFSNTSIPLITSTDPIQIVETSEEREVGRKFRAIDAGIQKITGYLQDSDELEDCPFIHKPWLRDWLPNDFSPTYPEIVKFLFEDVYQLPIATSRRHEIWAGAQMKAAGRLKKIVDDLGLISLGSVFVETYKQLNVHWQHLESLCIDNQLPLPNFVLWAGEVLTVRKDFYNTSRSRFRHFIKNIESSDCDEEIKESATNIAYDTFEMFWMLPDTALKFVREHGQELNDSFPSEEEFKEWLEVNADLTTHDLKMLLGQGLTARNKLVSGYFRSVLRFARNYVERFEDIDYLDLVQEGAIGLITAADKFEYRASARFITYATSWIWQITERSISEQVRNIRVPVHRHEQFKQLERAYQECLTSGLEMPEADILCLYMEFLDNEEIDKIWQHLNDGTDLTPKIKERWDKASKSTRRLLEYIEPTLSLSIEIPSELVKRNLIIEDVDTSCSLSEIIYDQQSQSDERNIVIQDLNDLITDLYIGLPARTQQIVNLRFGLEDGEERTLEEIGQRFGLTRERVRQLEKKALEYFGKRGSSTKRKLEEYQTFLNVVVEPPTWPGEILSYIHKNYSYWSKFDSFELPLEEDWQWLDALLEGLPGLGWHHREDGVSRKTQLEDALKTLKSPAHYSAITEQINDISGEDLEERAVYALLNFNYGNNFVLLGEGVFSLIEWERQRSLETEPILPFCPLPLPDIPGQTDTFLESVLIAQEFLNQKPKTSDFLTYMLKWIGVEMSPANWLKQSILNAYYLVGLIPYTFHFEGDDPVLSSTLPSLELSELRRYCLQKLTQRVMVMPEFWWTVRQYQPGTISNFAEHFGEVHPLESDDVGNRLKLLTGLGAVQRLPYGRYQLTSFGTSLAGEWARQPDFNELETEADVEVKVEEDLGILDLGLW
jgi:RNA polymerase sigma factor (sigma-70 family)